MGANASAQRDAKSAEDTSAMEERAADLSESRCGDEDDNVDAKQLQKNGQISVSSLNGKTDEQTEFNGPDEDNTLAEADVTGPSSSSRTSH
ncbi:hypothetical protein Q7C36_003500 [Tachysurus vachellii]|uniref:Uncharacterized protein n=1 Tax=Tachysurus vachellii TaxID=175792 RepID=A0AA88TF54_TACVA|nr:hypothetical protein Q7C36_003500 [Tachysurus vachellii]